MCAPIAELLEHPIAALHCRGALVPVERAWRTQARYAAGRVRLDDEAPMHMEHELAHDGAHGGPACRWPHLIDAGDTEPLTARPISPLFQRTVQLNLVRRDGAIAADVILQ